MGKELVILWQTHYIAIKGSSGMRSIVFRLNFGNGGYKRSLQSLAKSYTQRCAILPKSATIN